VAKEEALGWHGAEHAGVGVFGFVFGWADGEGFCGAAAFVLLVDVGELDVLDGVAGDAAKDGAEAGFGVVADDVVDENAAKGSDFCGVFGAAQTGAKAEEERRGADVAHGDVGNGDVFAEGAVFALEGEAVAAVEDAVGDGDVFEATVGLSAALDAAGAGDAGFGGEEFEGAVEEGAELVGAGDVAVGDGDVFGGAGVAEGKAALGADGVVPGGVDGAVGDADIVAAVDVDAVAVGVDFEVVDGEVVDAGEEEAEVAAFEDGEVAEDDVAAVFERDGLVGYAGLLGCIGGVVAARVVASAEA